MSSWAERLEAADDRWQRGDLDGAAALLREIAASGDDTVVPAASHALGRLLEERGDLDGSRAAHRSVIAGGHPLFAQRSAIALGLLLVEAEQWALAFRPLRIAATGADTEVAMMADVTLVQVLRMLGDLTTATEVLERVRRGDDPAGAELTEGVEDMRWPDDGGERERQAWDAYEAITALLDEDGADEEVDGVVLAGLNKMLSHGIPALCTQAAFRLYTIYAGRAEFEECRRVVEHAIAVGDPAERGMAENLLGAALFDLGEPAEAREAYRRAAEDHRPEVRLDALIQQSKFTRELGDEEEARAILRRVVESGHPHFALEARACLGQVHTEAGEVDEAIACWRVVLGSDSRFHRGAVLWLGTLLAGLPADDPRRAEIVGLLMAATELDDPDVAFQARLTLAQAETAVRGPDEEVEQAIDDCDAALERLRGGDPAAARALLRRVVDAGIDGQSERAARTLALLELGEGDPEQAAELLEHVADGPDFANGFAAALDRHLIASGAVLPGAPHHPVLTALVDYQRFGREAGIARYEECAGHPDPGVAALARSVLAQVYVSLGVPRSRGAELLDAAATAGDPLALSHAAVLSWLFHGSGHGSGADDEVIRLLRRAHEDGDPALAPWVAQALGAALQERDEDGDADAALAAFDAVSVSGHPGLRAEAESRMLQILEGRVDLAAAAAVHERIVARGDRVQAPRNAWLLGFTRVRLDDLAAARAAYELVAEDHPELAEDGVFARRLLARDFAGAATALAAVRRRGDDHRAAMTTWLTLEAAHAWQRAGETAAADAALALAVERGHPEHVQEAALYLGALRNDAGDDLGAAEAWARAAAGDDVHRARLGAKGLGEVRHRLGDLDGAAAAYRQALDATAPGEDDHRGLLEGALRALVGAGRAAEARELWAEQTGERDHAGLVIGAALEENGARDAAAAHYQQMIDSAGDDAGAAMPRVMLARLLADRGAAALAAELAGRAVTAFERLAAAGDEGAGGRHAATAYELGGYLTAAGDAAGAREAYERATGSADPGIRLRAKERLGSASPRERAWLRLCDGDRAGALRLLTGEYGVALLAELHVALLDRETEAARSLLGRAAGTGDAERAAAMLAAAVLDRLREDGVDGARDLSELVLEFGTPEHVATVADQLGAAHDLNGDTEAAVGVLRRGADAAHPAALCCLRRLIPLLAGQGDMAAAEAAARRAVASGDPETVTVGGRMLGDLAMARGDLADAAALYRTAIDSAGADAVPYIQIELGQVLWRLGESAAAHRAMESVLTCDDPGRILVAGTYLGAWLGEDGKLAGAAEAFGAAAAAGLRHPDPGADEHEWHERALNFLASIAFEADEAGDHAVSVRALHLAAAGGADDAAVQIAKRYAAAAAERGDLDAVRAYYKGAAAFPPDGDQTLLVELAELLGEHDAAEARALLEPLTSAADPHVRLAATAQLLPILQEAGEDDRALEVAARAAGRPVPLDATADAGRPEPDGRGEAGLVDPLRVYLRGEAGTPAAGAAGRRVIRTARQVMEYDPAQAREILGLVVEYGEPAEVAVAYDEIGEILGYLGDDMPAAVEAFRKGAEIDDPAALLPLRSLALALSELDDWDGVAEAAQRAVTSGDPHTVAAGYWLWGDSRRHRGDTDGAVRLYRQGIAVGYADITPRLHYELARALRDRGECDAARAELERAAEDTGSGLDVLAGRLLGAWAFDDGDLDAAAEAFGRVAAIDVDPDEPDHGLAKLVESAAGEVVRVVRRAADEGMHPVAVRALTRLDRAGYTLAALRAARECATECAESGDGAAAMLYAEGAAAFLAGPDPDPHLEIALADLMVAAGAPAEARERYERLVGHSDAEVRLVAAGRLVPLLRAAGDAEGLADITGRMADDSAETGLDPGAQALLGSMLGVMQSERGDHEGALRTLRAAAASGEPTALFTLGEALAEAGRPAEAREVLARIDVAEAAIGRRALVALGQTYHDEDAERARELYLRALDAPGEPDGTAVTLARMYLGSLAKRDRDWPTALRWYQQVIDSGGMTGGVSQASLAAAHLGELAYWLGDRDSAVRFYELTLATGTRLAHLVGEAAYRLGEIRHGDGDLDLAGKHLWQAVESGDEGFAERARVLLDTFDGKA